MEGHFYVGFRHSKTDDSLVQHISISSKPQFIEEDESPEPKPSQHSREFDDFEAVQHAFFNQMLAFLDVFPSSAHLIPALKSLWMSDFEKRTVEKHALETTLDGDWKIYKVPAVLQSSIVRSFNKSRLTSDAIEIFPQLMLLGLVSQFDAYTGKLLRVAISYRPDIVSKSQKTFPAHEVLQYPDIDTFKNAVIDKEVETFLRKSHDEQFDWLSSTFNIKTRDRLDSWPEFVEACERRNLFAHSNGIVSEQYRIKCLAAEAEVKQERGDVLDVGPKYLRRKVGVFLEIGIKIAQVISRKINDSDDNINRMDSLLNSISYELILHQHYEEAKKLLDFGCEVLKKHPDATLQNMMIVNRANAYKLSGKLDQAKKIVDAVDWSPFDPSFRISVAAVRDDVDEVVEIMPQLVGRKDFPMTSYRDWPVFTTIREHELFTSAFERLYGQPFTLQPLEAGSREPQEDSESSS